MAGRHEPVAVLGIGAMGHGMAASALRAGIPTIVWNRRMEATRDLAEVGAQVAETAADAARQAAIVVTMVTDADAVLSVARDQGMLAALAPGAIWAQMSTIGVAGIDRVAAMAGAQRPDGIGHGSRVRAVWQPAKAGSRSATPPVPADLRYARPQLSRALLRQRPGDIEAHYVTRLRRAGDHWTSAPPMSSRSAASSGVRGAQFRRWT